MLGLRKKIKNIQLRLLSTITLTISKDNILINIVQRESHIEHREIDGFFRFGELSRRFLSSTLEMIS